MGLTTPTPTASYSQNADGYERVINVITLYTILYGRLGDTTFWHSILLWPPLFTMGALGHLLGILVTSMVITVK